MRIVVLDIVCGDLPGSSYVFTDGVGFCHLIAFGIAFNHVIEHPVIVFSGSL